MLPGVAFALAWLMLTTVAAAQSIIWDDFNARVWNIRSEHPEDRQRVFLRIGSANYVAKVWVNGTVVAAHLGGYLPFVTDVTDQLTWRRPNVIRNIQVVLGREGNFSNALEA